MAEDEKPIRVVDRRMFTPDGELRIGFQPEEEPPPPAAPAPAAPKGPPPAVDRTAEKTSDKTSDKAAQSGSPPPADERIPATASEFLALVEFFASNISAALGYDPHSGQKAGRVNAAAARQMIDWLSLLEHKTRGNLSFEETDFLARMLYGLRLAYVEATQPPPK